VLDKGGWLGGPESKRSGGRAADEPAKDGFVVEAGRAEPVNRAGVGDQGGGAGVPKQSIVADGRPRRRVTNLAAAVHRPATLEAREPE
jgi:hypothetical protein